MKIFKYAKLRSLFILITLFAPAIVLSAPDKRGSLSIFSGVFLSPGIFIGNPIVFYPSIQNSSNNPWRIAHKELSPGNSALTNSTTLIYGLPVPYYTSNENWIPLEKLKLTSTQEPESELNIEGQLGLDLGYGFTFPLKSGITVGEGSAGITRGLKYDLIEKLLVNGSIGDRIYFEFDYDSQRSEEGLLEENNIYSVEYRGKEDEFLKEVTAGNKYLNVEGGRYVQMDEASPDSFALRVLGGWDQLHFNGIVRYDVGFEGEKVFSGNRRDVVDEVLDVDYIKATFFFIPDKDIDPDSLKLYVSSNTTKDITVDNKGFRLLVSGIDYDFDPSSGFIYLEKQLDSEDELICYYTKSGAAVGSTSLGLNAIVDENGNRADFNSNDFSQYFDSTKTYLYLKKRAFNSYWELRNAYPLPSYEGTTISSFNIELLYTSNSSPNSNYDDIINQFSIDSDRGVIFFNFTDEDGNFYPRPFPGFTSFTDPVNPTNPFDSQNPIYGGISYPTENQSINKLRFSYSFYTDTFFLDFNLIPGSIEVRVDGKLLDETEYEVDYAIGTITFSKGVITPTSEIKIKYRYTSFGGGNKGLLAQFGAFYETDFLSLKNLTFYRVPIGTQEAPDIGTEGKRDIYNSTEASIKIGAEDEEGPYLEVQVGAGVGLTNPNPHGVAVIEDMETSEAFFQIDTEADNWILGSESKILESNGVLLNTRGNLLYKNYYRNTVLSGEVLEDLSWDISQDHIFDYSEKSGPYNTKDHPPYSDKNSLVMDYEMPDGGSDDFVTMVTPIDPENFSIYEMFNILLKAVDVKGGAVRVYVELLKDYNEDIDGDGGLDGESSINDSGFVITPTGGQQTKLGSNREGRSNGRLDSEDINGNGILDKSENGVIVSNSDSSLYIIEFNTGDTDWQTLSIPLYDLIQSSADVLQYITAVRITITGTGTSQPLSGKILINRMWGSGTSIKNNSPDSLSISEVSVDENVDVYNHRFSESYPEIYEKLHGSSRYRTQTGHVEKTLMVNAISDIISDVSFSKRFGNQVDFSGYSRLNVYFYFPEGQLIPQNFYILIKIKSTEDQFIQATISGSSFRTGWNEVGIELHGSRRIFVNGSEIGTLSSAALLEVLKHITELEFFIQPGGDIINSGFTMWVDELHLSNPENYTSMAYYTKAKLGYGGNIISKGEFPILSDGFISGEYEKKSGSFSSGMGWVESSGLLETGLSVARAIRLSGSILYSEKTSAEKVDVEEFESPGESEIVVSDGIEYSPQNKWFPTLGHRYDFTKKNIRGIELEQIGFNNSISKEYENRFTIYTDYRPPFGLWSTWQLARGWIQKINEKRTSSSPDILQSTTTGELEHSNQISIGYRSGILSTGFSFTGERTFLGSGISRYSSWYDSYIQRIEDIFSRPSSSLNSAYLFSSIDNGSFDFELLPERGLGFISNIGFNYSESNFIEDQRVRDLLSTCSLNIQMPVYFDLFSITGNLNRYMTANYKKFSYDNREEELLLNQFKKILMPPFYYISPFPSLGREKDYNAVNLYNYGDTKNTLYNRYDLDVSINKEIRFLPDSFGFSTYGKTERGSGSYTQMRGYEGRVRKLFQLQKKDETYKKDIDTDLKYIYEKDYTLRMLKNTVECSVKYQNLREPDRGIVVDWNGSYQHNRQKRDDPALSLIPGSPESNGEIPEKPWEDKVSSTILFEWMWKVPVYRTLLLKILPYSEKEYYFKHSEKFKLEDIYTFTDRELAGEFSNVPVRFTFQHRTDLSLSDSLSFYGAIKWVIGVEEKIISSTEKGNFLPSSGFELDLGVKFLF